MAFGFIILLGFAALVAGTQPPDGNMNAVLLQFVTDKYPQWVIGLLAGTGFLLALAGLGIAAHRRFDFQPQHRCTV